MDQQTFEDIVNSIVDSINSQNIVFENLLTAECQTDNLTKINQSNSLESIDWSDPKVGG